MAEVTSDPVSPPKTEEGSKDDKSKPQPAPTSWADDSPDEDEKTEGNKEKSAAEKEAEAKLAAEKEAALLERFKAMDMSVNALHTGEILVRPAGSNEFKTADSESVEVVTSFSELKIDENIKKAITTVKHWHTMSRIQQVGLPLILKDPPSNFIGQAQAGTGKTGTFVISTLARITPDKKPSKPQAIILATTQELVTQIASEVNSLGQFAGISARRVMSSRAKDGTYLDTPWALQKGEDFDEQVVVGTVGMVKQYLNNASGRRPKKPCIDASEVKVLVLDEADHLVSYPPHGFGDDVKTVRNSILAKRKGKSCQILLFSATFTEEVKSIARNYVGDDKARYSEVTLAKKDVTLDKVVNFFVLVDSGPGASVEDVYRKKYEAILEIWASLADYNLGQSVIFVNTKHRAQNLADFLRDQGYDVGQIHGNMPKDERERVFAEFKEGKRPALVATNILSRGIDNPNVTLVINVDLPEKMSHNTSGFRDPDPETFVHRIGRSGRWTKKGASVSLISPLPNLPDLSIMKEIERQLFANEDVNRPMIQVPDPSQLGDALANNLEKISY